MTIQECKHLLSSMRTAKNRARAIRREIEEIEKDIAALSLKSSLGNVQETHGSGISKPVERIVERLDIQHTQLEDAYNEVFAIEDKLAAAIQELPEDEKEVIIDFYMRDRSLVNISINSYMSRRSVCYKKKSAINKIAKQIQ